ncbi:FUSC family protein [Streptomyces sp. NPDC046261]|uniref:FUSC family protein n=1 Tax=Streptomyces sp. NPDC046261 TaxID=3157200 RepID=UPI0033C7A68E
MAKPSSPRPRPLPLPMRGLIRLKPAAAGWPRPAFSAAAAMAVADGTLLALDRLDLALYTAAGALCALYGHDRPYALRARTLALVVLGAVGGVGVALTCAALTASAPLLVLCAALVAAVQKVVCDASRIGPPGPIVLTFITSTAFFVPQRPGEIPGRLGLVLAAGTLAWLICMAPALVRPHAPATGPRPAPGTLARLRRGSPLVPVGVRVAVGACLAGWTALALGSAHPYWAVVTAAAVFQANTTLSWQRAVQRVLGNLLGLLLFTALLPLVRTGEAALVLVALALQIGAEAVMARNYWLGSLCVTPMALLLGEFGGAHPAGGLVADRWTDTLVGAAMGLLVCVLITNRRAADRVDAALAHAAAARGAAAAALHEQAPDDEAARARDRLAAALRELREAADVAAGEWWQRALPQDRVALEEREGRRILAAPGERERASATAA